MTFLYKMTVWLNLTPDDPLWRDYYDKGFGIARAAGDMAGAQRIHVKPSCLNSDWFLKSCLWLAIQFGNTSLFLKPVKDCTQRCFNFKEYFYIEPDIGSFSKNRKFENRTSESDIDVFDDECNAISETECNFSSDASNCSDWFVSIIRQIFKMISRKTSAWSWN